MYIIHVCTCTCTCMYIHTIGTAYGLPWDQLGWMQYDLVNFRENHIGVVLHANPSPPTSRKSVYDNNRAIFMCVEQFILSTERMHSSIYPFPGLYFKIPGRPAWKTKDLARNTPSWAWTRRCLTQRLQLSKAVSQKFNPTGIWPAAEEKNIFRQVWFFAGRFKGPRPSITSVGALTAPRASGGVRLTSSPVGLNATKNLKQNENPFMPNHAGLIDFIWMTPLKSL